MTRLHNQRMKRFVEAGLYVVTSMSVSRGRSTVEIVRACLSAGVRLIQLREKDLSTAQLYNLALKVREMTARAGALFLVNDNLDVALASRADGAHLGQDDLPTEAARRLAPDLIIGASSSCLQEALDAERAGASYVNIGPVFPTSTREGCEKGVGLARTMAIGKRLKIPFTVMGGIKLKHVPGLVRTGASSIAVISAVTAADDPEAAARELLAAVRRTTLRADPRTRSLRRCLTPPLPAHVRTGV
ncbi:MAG: thiamine phosphate synthase [Verrucomicrobia bacterium]|nr:thiamine phosphate synthase [Verrucomicrobiota bacterium]